MELRQLKYFVAVAEELHFGRAAMRINISQPPLSMQIRNLEEELGLSLFRRTSRSVELTEAGKTFLYEARCILEKVEQAIRAARDTASGYTGQIAVGFVSPAIDSFLPAAIRNFHQCYPRIKLALVELSTNRQIDCLCSERIQVGFIRFFEYKNKNLCCEVVWKEPYVLALSDSHHLAANKSVALSDLKGQPMIIYPRSLQPALYDKILKCCELAGFKPKISQEVRSKHTTTALVAAGLGCAIVPESSKALRRDGVIYLPIRDSLPVVKIAMIWRSDDDSPVLGQFLDTIKNGPKTKQ